MEWRDGQGAVGGRVARAETGTAEGVLDDRTGGHELGGGTVAHQGDGLGLAGGVDGERELAAAGAPAVQDGGGHAAVLEGTARATGDDALIHPHAAVMDLVAQLQAFTGLAELLAGLFFHGGEQLVGMAHHLGHRIGVAGMEGQGHHGLDGGQVHADAAIEAGGLVVTQLGVIIGPAVHGQVIAHLVVRGPDGGQTGGLGGHDVDTAAVFHGKARHAGTGEFHDPVLDEAVLEHRADKGDGDVLRAHAGTGSVLQPDQHHFGTGHVIGLAQQLLDQLGAAFAHGHGAQGAVAGVAVGAQDHLAATGHHFTGVLVDDRQMGRHEDAAVLAGGGQAEEVVVLIDGAAHGAQAVVAVGERVGHGEAFQAAGAGRLDDAHIGDVVRGQGVKTQAQGGVVPGSRVVGGQDVPGQGILTGSGAVDAARRGFFLFHQGVALHNDRFVAQLDHLASCVVCAVP